MSKAKSEIPHQDFSTSNARLHRLYVRRAQEELVLYAEIIERLSEFSRINPSIMAGMIHKERASLIKSNTAYQEAVWRILVDDLLPDEEETSVTKKAV